MAWKRVVVCEPCEQCFEDVGAAKDHFVESHLRHDQYRGGCRGHEWHYGKVSRGPSDA